MEFMGTVTFGIALLGAVLGIINTWRNIDRDRVRLLVKPAHAIPVGAMEHTHPNIEFGIEVVNLSVFPVIVSEVGFLHRGLDSRAAAMQPLTLDGKTTPRKLEPRESASFYMVRPEPRDGHPIKCAYANTSCGRTFKGTSPALLQFNRRET